MRDPTRGGLAAVLTEFVERQPFGVRIRERDIPVREDVRGVSELLGFDPLHLANEGKAVLVVRAADEAQILQVLRSHPLGRNAVAIGQVTSDAPGVVRVETEVGGLRRLQRPAGELLPRIC